MKNAVFVLMLIAVLLPATATLAADIEVGVAWYSKSGMADRVLEGMTTRLAEIAPQIKLELHTALADEAALAAVVNDFQQNKAGMVIMRSSCAKSVGKMQPSIPTFIGASNHPSNLGIIGNVDAPEGNITGVSYALSAESQFSTFTAILPEMKSVYLILEDGHPSSAINDADTKVMCTQLGFDFQSKLFKSVDEITAAVVAEKDNFSIFLIGSQALVMDNAAAIVAAAGKTPVMAYAQKPVNDGALCGLSADDSKLGSMLADSIVDVLVNGKSISSVPVKFDDDPKLYINGSIIEKLQLEVPYEILSMSEIIE